MPQVTNNKQGNKLGTAVISSKGCTFQQQVHSMLIRSIKVHLEGHLLKTRLISLLFLLGELIDSKSACKLLMDRDRDIIRVTIKVKHWANQGSLETVDKPLVGKTYQSHPSMKRLRLLVKIH